MAASKKPMRGDSINPSRSKVQTSPSSVVIAMSFDWYSGSHQFNPEPAYPPPINHIGINRIALMVPDVDRSVAILKAQGVEFLSEPAPCCSGTGEDQMAIVHAIDPDGVFLELVGGIAKRPPEPHPAHCPPLEIKMPPAQS
ncbi:MAG: hypothetical protein HC809_05140 [Gammaproteobacteria bacterium]|nr:hypothetical protein [Gammaproteobacteria bacterium]